MNSQTSVKYVSDKEVTSYQNNSNVLEDNFSHNSSSDYSADAFEFVRKKAEKQTINFSSDNAEV